MTNIVRHYNNVYRGPSPIIFGDLAKLREDNYWGRCLLLFDDFAAPTNHASASASGGYYTYQDTGVTIGGYDGPPDLGSAANKAEQGVLRITHDGTDEDEGHVQFGHGGAFVIDNGSGNTGKLMFEARVKKSNITDDRVSQFIGLGTGPVAADYMVDATGALIATKGFIGFLNDQDDGDQWDTAYQALSQAFTELQANAATIVAATYQKLGFLYDPTQLDATKKIRFFVDGVELNTGVSTTNIDAATFPEGEALAPIFLTKISTANAITVDIDWICCAQYVDNAE